LGSAKIQHISKKKRNMMRFYFCNAKVGYFCELDAI
jgi:hypothetical protein